jgi:hypothetical protein
MSAKRQRKVRIPSGFFSGKFCAGPAAPSQECRSSPGNKHDAQGNRRTARKAALIYLRRNGNAIASKRSRSRSPLAADLRMRSASAVFDIMARCSGLRLCQASSRTPSTILTLLRSSWTGSLVAMKYLAVGLPQINGAMRWSVPWAL